MVDLDPNALYAFIVYVNRKSAFFYL